MVGRGVMICMEDPYGRAGGSGGWSLYEGQGGYG